MIDAKADRRVTPSRYLALALGLSLLLMVALAPLGYAALVVATGAAWITRQPRVTRWVLTAITVALVAVVLIGLQVGADPSGTTPTPPRPRA